jgi:hypothetical protein
MPGKGNTEIPAIENDLISKAGIWENLSRTFIRHADDTEGQRVSSSSRYVPSFARILTGTQLVVGMLLLSDLFVPLAMALIAPIIVGIVTFHIFLAPSGSPMAAAVFILEIYLAWTYRRAFLPMLTMRIRLNAK